MHLPKDQLVNFLRNIIGMLTEDGVFFCDECDNRSVEFKPNNNHAPIAPYKEATKMWSVLSLALINVLKNDLELTAEKIKIMLQEASEAIGHVCIEGQYQVTLHGKDQKKLITDGYRSSKAFFASIGKPIEGFIDTFDACIADDCIDVPFLTESVATFCK